jgi:hypothetical protein
MSIKFGRNYSLEVQGIDGSTITITLPFTIEFDIKRDTLTSANNCTFRIYNLSPKNRNLIRRNLNDWGDRRQIRFRGGYGQTLPLCFTGFITQAFSVREGVNFITQIEAFDAGFAFATGAAVTIPTFPKGTSRQDVTAGLIKALPGVDLGAVGPSVQGTLKRANSHVGNPIDVLRDLYPTTPSGVPQFFIDLGKGYVLKDFECLPADGITQVDFSTGLLETPVREQQILHFPMLFEPRLIMAQKLTVVSVTEPILSGEYRVVSLRHAGTISDAVAGDARTDVGLFAPYRDEKLQVIGLTP